MILVLGRLGKIKGSNNRSRTLDALCTKSHPRNIHVAELKNYLNLILNIHNLQLSRMDLTKHKTPLILFLVRGFMNCSSPITYQKQFLYTLRELAHTLMHLHVCMHLSILHTNVYSKVSWK